MFSRRVVTVLGLLLAITAPAVFGAPPAWDSDSPDPDGVPNNVEYWMQRWGALVGIPAVDNASPTPQPILAWTTNTYVDSDGDGIPDVVEALFTHTDPTIRDDVACAGGGSPNLTGQYEVRRAANLANPVDFLADELSAISVCHTSNSPGGIRVFEPRMGYATSASISGGGPYTLSANWNYLGTAVAFTGNCPSPCTGTNIVVTGTLSIGGALAAASATRRAAAAPGAASVNGLYAGQVTHFPHQVGASADKLQDLGSGAIQINYLSNSQARVYSKETYEAYPAYYSALTGTVFYTTFVYVADAYKDPYDPANSNDDVSRIALMLTEAPVSGVGGRIRGSDTGLYTSPGQAIAVTENQIYGKASAPNAGGVTVNRRVGVGSLLYLNNVPVSADSATITGPEIEPYASTIWDDLDDDPSNSVTESNNRNTNVSLQLRLPGFTDGVKVGFDQLGNDLNVSNISYRFPRPLANNDYTFNFFGAVGGYSAVPFSHVDHSLTPLPVVDNVQMNSTVLAPARPMALTGLNMNVDNVLTWSPVSTGGIGNNGVGATGGYRVIITNAFNNRVIAPDGYTTITDVSPNSVNLFVPAAACCSVTIKGGTLDATTPYRIVIEAQDDSDANNRSQTDPYYVNLYFPFRADDFDGYGASDILWRNVGNGALIQWLMAGPVADMATAIGGDSDWTIVGTGDFNDDGKADILWRNVSDGGVIQWLMSGSTVTTTTYIGGDSDWTIAGTGDFNGDGTSDILWRNTGHGGVFLWLMDGTAMATTTHIGGDINWTVAGTGDFDGDGKSDILWRNVNNGAVILWLMNGASVATAAPIGGDINWTVAGTGDFDGDGKSDILWRNTGDGGVIQWLMDGTSMTTATYIGGDTNWTVAGTGDFDGDGKSDILWRNIGHGGVFQWLMDGTSMTTATYIGGDTNWTVVP
jgi:hypothetical protein